MAYDEELAMRVRPRLEELSGFSEKKMFGGLGFLLFGNMCCGVWKEFLILRIGKDHYEEALEQPYISEFDITGRAMTGWVMIESDGFDHESELQQWLQQAITFCLTLPPKEK